MEVPVALIEQEDTGPDSAECRVVLLFREGLLNASVLAALGRLLQHL
jgi:hypothetical protein